MGPPFLTRGGRTVTGAPESSGQKQEERGQERERERHEAVAEEEQAGAELDELDEGQKSTASEADEERHRFRGRCPWVGENGDEVVRREQDEAKAQERAGDGGDAHGLQSRLLLESH